MKFQLNQRQTICREKNWLTVLNFDGGKRAWVSRSLSSHSSLHLGSDRVHYMETFPDDEFSKPLFYLPQIRNFDSKGPK